MEPVIKSRRGNPNFGKKKEEETNVPDLNKQYIFQLLRTHEKQKPVDSVTGELKGSPFQPYYAVVNSGMAWDPNFTPKGASKPGAQRRWRYLSNFPTIWVDEQIDPEPSPEDLNSNTNDLIFRQGVLRVFGHETTKLQALQLNNTFDGCVRPLKNLPKEFTLLDQDKIDKEVLEALDDAFNAEKAAREATREEMYACSYYFGINLNQSDDGIRKEFIKIARDKPRVFNREFVNPKNKYKYVFLEGLAENIISGTIVEGTVYLVDSNTKVWDLKTGDIAEELAQNVVAGDVKATNLYNKLDTILKNEK